MVWLCEHSELPKQYLRGFHQSEDTREDPETVDLVVHTLQSRVQISALNFEMAVWPGHITPSFMSAVLKNSGSF